MKKVYIIGFLIWFYGVVINFVGIGSIAFGIVFLILGRDNPTIGYLYGIFPIFVVSGIFFFIIVGKYFFQYIKVDEEGLIGCNLFGKIMSMKWEEIDYVKVRAMNILVERDFGAMMEFVGKEEKKPLQKFKRYKIQCKYSKKRIAFLKTVCPEINIEFEGMEQL